MRNPAMMLAAATILAGTGAAANPVDAIFADFSQGQSPGCAVAVYQDGDVVFSKGYGMANLEYSIPITPKTKFRLASVSKQFAAMALALLAEEGKLSLDDHVQKYFPEMPVYDSPVTLRHLIHHQSGLRDYLDLAFLAEWGDAYSESAAINMVQRQQGLNFEPGSQYAYSNTGYMLMARIVQIVTGQTLEEWSYENQFEPLGMHDTHWHRDHTHVVKDRAYGYRQAADGRYHMSMTTLDIVGDGALMTNVEDLLLWDNNFYDNQLGKGSSSLIKMIETPARFNNGDTGDYAFGLTVETFQGTPEIWHSGGWYGVSTSMHRYPEHRLTTTVLCNDEGIWAERLARRVAAVYLGVEDQVGSETHYPDSAAAAQSVDALSADSADEYAGSYFSEELAYTLELVSTDGVLTAVRRDGAVPLEWLGDDSFDYAGYEFIFERDADGAITGISMRSPAVLGLFFSKN